MKNMQILPSYTYFARNNHFLYFQVVKHIWVRLRRVSSRGINVNRLKGIRSCGSISFVKLLEILCRKKNCCIYWEEISSCDLSPDWILDWRYEINPRNRNLESSKKIRNLKSETSSFLRNSKFFENSDNNFTIFYEIFVFLGRTPSWKQKKLSKLQFYMDCRTDPNDLYMLTVWSSPQSRAIEKSLLDSLNGLSMESLTVAYRISASTNCSRP